MIFNIRGLQGEKFELELAIDPEDTWEMVRKKLKNKMMIDFSGFKENRSFCIYYNSKNWTHSSELFFSTYDSKKNSLPIFVQLNRPVHVNRPPPKLQLNTMEQLKTHEQQPLPTKQPLPTIKLPIKHLLPKKIEEYYPHYTLENKSRWHFFKAHTEKTAIQGDALKSAILNQFKESLESCSSQDELLKRIDEIKKSPNYQVLAKGQGLATRLFHLKTSSLKAFEAMCDNLKATYSSPKNTG